jgi:hypothetical protein
MKWLRRQIYGLMCGISLKLLSVVWEGLGYNLGLHQLSGPPGNRVGSTDDTWLVSHLIRLHRLDIQRMGSLTPGADWLLILSPSRWTPLPMQVKSGRPGVASGADVSGTLSTSRVRTRRIFYDNFMQTLLDG